MKKLSTLKLLFTCFIFFIAFNYPMVHLFAGGYAFGCVPVLYIYLFAIWVLLIFFHFFQSRDSQ